MAAISPSPTSRATSLPTQHHRLLQRRQPQSQLSPSLPLPLPSSSPPSSPGPNSKKSNPVAQATVTQPVDTNSANPSSTTHRQQQHQSAPHQNNLKTQKSGGFLAIAAAAFDKTIGNVSEPTLRNRQSSSTLGRLSVLVDSPTSSDPSTADNSPSKLRSLSSNSSAASTPVLASPLSDKGRWSSSLSKDPISKPYSATDPTRPPPVLVHKNENKMHQTSSRLLRMTDDDRPFTRDFKDLFSTLIVSLLPLSAHRVRLTRVEHTFLSEDAINNLGSLKFSQSNRMPDPKDPSRIVTTTTTTTFSMARDMARSICQRFVDARFIESADGKMQPQYTMKGAVWQLTAKGICILDRFCSRNGIQQRQIADLIATGMCHLCILERDVATDKLMMDRGTIEVLFRRLMGSHGLNIKSTVSSADSESLSDYRDGYTGVKVASERRVAGKTYKDTFTGKACSDWLMDCCTTVDRRETYEMATLFVEYELMEAIQVDRVYLVTAPGATAFQPTKNAIFHLTPRGKEVLNGGVGRGRTSESEGLTASARLGVARDSNTQRLDKILNDPALRLLFRENLRDTHCEENLSFYKDVDEFVRGCRLAIRAAQKNPSSTASMDGVKEIMAQAYGIYNAFLAPGSPCELNIDHQLRNNLATRMTKAVGQDVAMIDTLQEVMSLFEDAQNAVFKLMASDSVPKFLRNVKYENTLKNYDFDSIMVSGRLLERSQSRTNRK